MACSILLLTVGCLTPQEYKEQADDEVYKIIDDKWSDGFGSQDNYRINDLRDDPNYPQIILETPADGVFSLGQAVQWAIVNNRDYQLQKEELYFKTLDLTLERHQFSNIFGAGANGQYATDGEDEAIGSQAGVSFNKLLANGTMISSRIAGAWVEILTGNIRRGLASVFSTTITHPILRGGSRDVVTENLTQAERDSLYQIRRFSRYRKAFVVSVVTQYYRVLELYEARQNSETNCQRLDKVYKQMQVLADAGRLPTFEMDEAQQDWLRGRDIFIQSKKQYRQALDEFKIVLALPADAQVSLDQRELDILRAATMGDPTYSEQEAIDTAAVMRLDLANQADRLADADRKIIVAADGLRADLKIIGTMWESTDDIVNTSPSSIFGETFGDGDDIARFKTMDDEYGLGVELDLPFDRKLERNIYRKALIYKMQAQRAYEHAADTVVLEVRKAYRDLREANQRYEVQKLALELAQKRFDNTFDLVQYGRANTRDVLDAQKDLFDAQLNAVETLLDYSISTANFYRDAGVLQVLPDGAMKY